MTWTTVDSNRIKTGRTLALPVAVAESLEQGSAPVDVYDEPALDRQVVGKRVAVWDRPLAEALREPQLQTRLEHDHLVPVITVSDVLDTTTYPPKRLEDEVIIFTPYYENGSVLDALDRGRTFGVREALDIARAGALGLAELHREGIVHRDFKSPNLFLTGDARLARVGDLGEAAPLGADGRAPGLDSPTPWIAPEQVARGEATVLSDLFGLGVTLVEMLQNGLGCWPSYDRAAAHARMVRGLTPLPRSMMRPPPWAPPPVRTLVRQLTESDPGKRRPATAAEVADRLAASPAIGWLPVVFGETHRRWEGEARADGRGYALDARYLPRNREWELCVERLGTTKWIARHTARMPELTEQTLQDAFAAALRLAT